VPEPAEVRALVEKGYLRMTDIAPTLGVSIQRVSQIVTEREDFPMQGDRAASAVATRGRGAVAGLAASGVGSGRVTNAEGQVGLLTHLSTTGPPR
jgi:hypothetical protein